MQNSIVFHFETDFLQEVNKTVLFYYNDGKKLKPSTE